MTTGQTRAELLTLILAHDRDCTTCGQRCGLISSRDDSVPPWGCCQGLDPSGAMNGCWRGSAAAVEEANRDSLVASWPEIINNISAHQRAWLADSKPLMLAEGTAVVAVPNSFTRSQIESKLRPRLEDALTEAFGEDIRIVVTVD